ncbi:prepilin-type N-terminal cleavage/methylation domain-containing protein [candidate division KSB3 bacterium]|uniref:Prepilin-type N-terminal cleavage/methylation domain-containing protein n=1 Tax=candidate division KSB3 bacterium TaxID=2044937 RepID=A0A9D5JSF7_9BACT|nr:prepilin-type N-terminal cleavage/methylation domain-containing protein [candidate division KSB3 bacterium]MBD3323417.1 prepilin-type N-terminal cleavage/methylation domain-containing protein [candidate division KSB3 bacterium]
MMIRFTHNDKGVTLLEMLVVVAIIGIIATITVPNFIEILRNHQTRSAAMTLLTDMRRERSRALSLSREIQMTIKPSTETYDVKVVAYTLRNPATGAPLFDEAEKTLVTDKDFDPKDGLVSITPSSNVNLTFYPSGTINTTTTLELDGPNLGYTIKVYKGGQISLEGRTN